MLGSYSAVIAQGYVKPLYIALFCERIDTTLKGLFLVPNYNEKRFFDNSKLFVMYTILLITISL